MLDGVDIMKNDFDELELVKHLAKPFYFKGSEVGVLLVHGFTASTTEMLPLGKFLQEKGFSVHGVLLAGHGTNYRDLPNYTWHQWYQSVEDGFFFLKESCKTIIPIGISMGALLCLYLVQQHFEEGIRKLILLAPPFRLKSRLVRLMPLLNLIIKFSYKGEGSLQYFKDHNLYSYMYRPTASVIQLTRLIKHIDKQSIRISTPTLISYGALDDMISISGINVAKEKKFADDATVDLLELPNSGHILTVEPDSKELFTTISKFIKKSD